MPLWESFSSKLCRLILPKTFAQHCRKLYFEMSVFYLIYIFFFFSKAIAKRPKALMSSYNWPIFSANNMCGAIKQHPLMFHYIFTLIPLINQSTRGAYKSHSSGSSCNMYWSTEFNVEKGTSTISLTIGETALHVTSVGPIP